MGARVFSAALAGLILAHPPHVLGGVLGAGGAHAAIPAGVLGLALGGGLITVAITAAVVTGCVRIRRAERRMRAQGASRAAPLGSAPGVKFCAEPPARELRPADPFPASAEPEPARLAPARSGAPR